MLALPLLSMWPFYNKDTLKGLTSMVGEKQHNINIYITHKYTVYRHRSTLSGGPPICRLRGLLQQRTVATYPRLSPGVAYNPELHAVLHPPAGHRHDVVDVGGLHVLRINTARVRVQFICGHDSTATRRKIQLKKKKVTAAHPAEYVLDRQIQKCWTWWAPGHKSLPSSCLFR